MTDPAVKQTDRRGATAAARRLIVCADDFATNAAVSTAILELLALQRISATSCMSDSPRWPVDGAALRERGWQKHAGLHFDLTADFPGRAGMPLGRLMLAARCGALAASLVRTALERQLDRYERVMAAAPAFVDGHQHIHLFPVIREQLFDVLARRYTQRPWLRNLAEIHTPAPLAKRLALSMMGATGHGRQAAALGWSGNRGFAGLYALRPQDGFAERLPHWLSSLPDDGLLMCHPAKQAETDDAIGQARRVEFACLASAAWPAMLTEHGRVLVAAPLN
ncbi:ChbG/HpnK family deacetylase [Chitinimonas arctica]|nr:ChbG/HpnK family deacetylase [Chitinimonas arctica]